MLWRSQKDTDTWSSNDDTQVSFLDEAGAESVVALTTELRNRVATVEQQVLSQYTATAAYVTLAQQHTEAARAEARADLDRVQDTVIGLIEQVRADVKNRLDCANIRPEPPLGSMASFDTAARIGVLEDRLEVLVAVLEQCVHENIVLRQQFDQLMLERNRADGWLFATGNTGDLTLH